MENLRYQDYFKKSQESAEPLGKSLGATQAEVNAEAAIQATNTTGMAAYFAFEGGDITNEELSEIKDDLNRKAEILKQRGPLNRIQEKHRKKHG